MNEVIPWDTWAARNVQLYGSYEHPPRRVVKLPPNHAYRPHTKTPREAFDELMDAPLEEKYKVFGLSGLRSLYHYRLVTKDDVRKYTDAKLGAQYDVHGRDVFFDDLQDFYETMQMFKQSVAMTLLDLGVIAHQAVHNTFVLNANCERTVAVLYRNLPPEDLSRFLAAVCGRMLAQQQLSLIAEGKAFERALAAIGIDDEHTFWNTFRGQLFYWDNNDLCLRGRLDVAYFNGIIPPPRLLFALSVKLATENDVRRAVELANWAVERRLSVLSFETIPVHASRTRISYDRFWLDNARLYANGNADIPRLYADGNAYTRLVRTVLPVLIVHEALLPRAGAKAHAARKLLRADGDRAVMTRVALFLG